MPIYRDKKRSGAFVFEFDRVIPGQGRVRARKRLPKSWTAAQADEFDRIESARLYAVNTGVTAAADAKPKVNGEPLIEDALVHYLTDVIPTLKTGLDIARELRNLYPLYAGKPLSALHAVAGQIEKMKRDGKDSTPLQPATIRNRIRYLMAACRYAWKKHRICEHNPAEGILLPKIDNERQVYILREEMLMAARACKNRKARMAIRIAYYSGMRLGEIMRAKVTRQGWQLDTTKNKQPRIVPIHSKVAVCARQFHKLKGAKITMQRNWEKARSKVGLDHVRFHDLRHSTASGLINKGVDLFVVGRVLGHKDPRSTARYAHLDTSAQEAALSKLGQRNRGR